MRFTIHSSGPPSAASEFQCWAAQSRPLLLPMKSLALATCLAAAATSAGAQIDQWIGLTLSDDGTEVKASANSIRPVMGDRVTMWTLSLRGPPRRLKSGEVVTYSRSRWFADCSRRTLGLTEFVDYNDDGKVVLRHSIPQPGMTPVDAESVGELIFQFACDADFRAKQTEWYQDPINKPMPSPSASPSSAEGKR